MRSYRISPALYLVEAQADPATTTPVQHPSTNHLLVVDCSGSMGHELPKIRNQLKQKLQSLVKERDTISIVWFSGRGQFGTLLEGEVLANLADLKGVNEKIDRWLKPVGMTGFKEPLLEVRALTERLLTRFPNNVFSLFFMSDGCDNEWSRAEVIKAAHEAAHNVSRSTFVEYGFYADRQLLTSMAEEVGGNLIVAQDFDKYAVAFEETLGAETDAAPRVELRVGTNVVGDFAFAFDGANLCTYVYKEGTFQVPAGRTIWFVSPVACGEVNAVDMVHIAGACALRTKADPASALERPAVDAAYAAVSLFALRVRGDVVLPLLKALGDVTFIEQFNRCFGKQRYTDFAQATQQAATDPSVRFTQGFDPRRIPRDDAFTVLDFLQLLAQDRDNRVLLTHPEFKYARIGRSKTDANLVLTREETKEVAQLTEQIGETKDPETIAKLAGRIYEITGQKGDALSFKEDEAKAQEGYPVNSLTYNEERPNISIKVTRPGFVDLSSKLGELPTEALKPVGEEGFTTGLAKAFPTAIHRNYAIIKDGLVNVDVLPVKISKRTFDSLQQAIQEGKLAPQAISQDPTDSSVKMVALNQLPIVNRQMVRNVSAKELFRQDYQLTKLRATQKVCNSLKKELELEGKSKYVSLSATYGAPVASWLKGLGVTEQSFSPQMVTDAAKDFYIGKELKVSIKGLGELPSLNEVRKRASEGKKPNAAHQLMLDVLEEVKAFKLGDSFMSAKDPTAVFSAWLEQKAQEAGDRCDELIRSLAQLRFSVIVGQVWFHEFASMEDTTLLMDLDGKPFECTVQMHEPRTTI